MALNTQAQPPSLRAHSKSATFVGANLAALDDARAAGRGAVTLGGRMIDAASIRQAEQLLAKVSRPL